MTIRTPTTINPEPEEIMPIAQPRPTPASLILLGWFGTLAALGGLAVGALGLAALGNMPKRPSDDRAVEAFLTAMDREAPAWEVIETGRVVGVVVLSLLLLIGSFGLLLRKPWARIVIVIHGLFQIPLQVVYVGYELFAIHPVMEKYQWRPSPALATAAVDYFAVTQIVMFLVAWFFVMVAVVWLLAMFSSGIKAALAPADRMPAASGR
jgi:hypothetical protein